MYKYACELDRVVDGDTVDLFVDLGFNIAHKIRTRLLDYDAPETRTRDLAEKARGYAAKAYAEELLTNAESLIVHTHKTGKYGRWLADIEFPDGTFLVAMMKAEGMEK